MFEPIPEIRSLNTSVTDKGQTCLSSEMAERPVSWAKAGIAKLLENEILAHTGPLCSPQRSAALSPLRSFEIRNSKSAKGGERSFAADAHI